MRTKTGLDFFPIDVDLLSDDKLTIYQADYGNRGLGVLLRLLSEIYRNGYQLPWSEREQKRFALRCYEPIGDVVAMVETLINEGFFDSSLARSEAPILTSAGIQKRWKLASCRRANNSIPNAHNLIAFEDVNAGNVLSGRRKSGGQMQTKEAAIADILPTSCEQYVDNMLAVKAQSKVKESRVKESKEKKEAVPLVFPESLDTPDHRNAWAEFLDHKRRIRKPYKSIESQNEQLRRWSARPNEFIAAIRDTIANEWVGLQWEKDYTRKSNSGDSRQIARSLELVEFFRNQEG
jgi:hypothetical protein